MEALFYSSGNSHLRMGMIRTMLPVEEVDIAAVEYKVEDFQGEISLCSCFGLVFFFYSI